MTEPDPSSGNEAFDAVLEALDPFGAVDEDDPDASYKDGIIATTLDG